MLDIKKRIALIESLVAENSDQSLSYAASECRLTIEYLCYERLLQSHGYLARSDLKKWSPIQVVKQVADEANELIASGFTLYISAAVPDIPSPSTIEEFEAAEYVSIGEQVAFNLGKMNKLWNGLSNVALHISVPVDETPLSVYGSSESIRSKVTEAVSEFRKLENGSLLGCLIESTWSFHCEKCDALITRNAKLVKDKQIVNCFSPTCNETYELRRSDDEILYVRREACFVCKDCGVAQSFPAKLAEELRYGQKLDISCSSCGKLSTFRQVLVYEISTP
jgi:hypothetical protein